MSAPLQIPREPMTPRAAYCAFIAVALDAVGRYHHSKGLQVLQASRPEDRRHG